MSSSSSSSSSCSPILYGKVSKKHFEHLRNSPDLRAFIEFLDKKLEEQVKKGVTPPIDEAKEKEMIQGMMLSDEKGRLKKEVRMHGINVMSRHPMLERMSQKVAQEHIEKYGPPDTAAIIRALTMKAKNPY